MRKISWIKIFVAVGIVYTSLLILLVVYFVLSGEALSGIYISFTPSVPIIQSQAPLSAPESKVNSTEPEVNSQTLKDSLKDLIPFSDIVSESSENWMLQDLSVEQFPAYLLTSEQIIPANYILIGDVVNRLEADGWIFDNINQADGALGARVGFTKAGKRLSVVLRLHSPNFDEPATMTDYENYDFYLEK